MWYNNRPAQYNEDGSITLLDNGTVVWPATQ